ncbi:MAG: YbjN domain-containing protein, partial [Aestuariivirga sp.]
MTATANLSRPLANPLDRLERLAETRSWHLDRTNDNEIVMEVGGGWSDLNISLTWRDDLESLHFCCMPELRVPGKRRDEALRLVSLINAQLMHGHIDMWTDGTIVYRNTLLLTGGAEANDSQCEAMVSLGVDAVHHYYPAFNFV